MVRLIDLSDAERDHIMAKELPSFETRPWVEGPSLAELADEMAKRDVVFLGEEHGNAVGHLQQMQIVYHSLVH